MPLHNRLKNTGRGWISTSRSWENLPASPDRPSARSNAATIPLGHTRPAARKDLRGHSRRHFSLDETEDSHETK